MTRISKRFIDKKILERIYQLFFEVFLRSRSKSSFLQLVDDLFSPTEKIMIAKRIAIMYLLIKRVDYKDIAEALKVSSSTVVSHARLFYKRNTEVVTIVREMLLKEKVLGFLEDIFANLFIQPGFKMGHYKMDWEHKKRIERRKILG